MRARGLHDELGALLPASEFRVSGNEVVVRPATAERLGAALRWSRHQPQLRVRHDLGAFDAVGEPDLTSCLIRAGSAAPLHRVEAALQAAGLTLGPLSPLERKLTVGAWLSGPHGGQRPIPGGRLETAALTLEAVLWTGELYRSHATPRSAAGPDLDHLLLSGGDAVGLLTSATLRAFSRPTTDDRAALSLGAPSQAAAILRDVLGHEALPSRAQLQLVDGRPTLTATFSNLAFRAHRDAHKLREVAKLNGASAIDTPPLPIDEARLTRQFEVSWEALPAVLTLLAADGASLHRIARESLVVSTPLDLDGDGIVPLDRPATKPAWLEQLSGRMGGER